jgi:DNA-binding transcriptional ArsR family regulator
MEKQRKVDDSQIFKEIASISKQSHDIVRGIVQAYHAIVTREIGNNAVVVSKNYMSLQAKYRKSALINKSGVPVVGGYSIHVNPSRILKRALNSKEPIEIPVNLFENPDNKVIKELKNELKGKKLTAYHALNKAEIVKKKYEERMKGVQERSTKIRKKHQAKKISRIALKRRAAHLLKKKVVHDRINSTYFLDAITSYPVITKFYKSQQMSINVLNMFIIINHFQYFELKDAKLFGIPPTTVTRSLDVLIENGLVEKFKEKKNQYAVSLNGKKKFKEFATLINKDMRVLLNKYKEKFEDKEAPLPIKSKLWQGKN